MRTEDFDYDLPDERVAQQPAEPRDSARLLVDRGTDVEHRTVRDLPDLLREGDLLVVNDTRVLPARLCLRKATGGAAEVLLLEPDPADPLTWEALVRPGRRIRPGSSLFAEADGRAMAVVQVGGDRGDGRRQVRLIAEDVPSRFGEVPLPPYVREALADPERYQTVFADRPSSVAAPTAGLHLTPEVLDRCRQRGIEVVAVELSVGLGTFRPISVDDIDDHVMHEERYRVPVETLEALDRAQRVVAVGTTVVRTLETLAATGQTEGRTDLFIRRGHPWKTVDVLLTNFHVPRSSLLVMIDAFVGDRWRNLYDTAQADCYRFLSFGDALLLERARLLEKR
ncbi:MAG: tRNA preQ1(34) S-adenosylmethionine ribosyltransferase-isomerase QueA [Actinomycetia bacterium]|nr:tRNA preQ1(34) S-adenosylmethionine ribosyltransferase-isomerase QueA [Actinomycetes bacterium]MCP3911758.1 tRNA preQ1(34) S-adenosylmethionine ribosyltransferase-isomerase QueA [Actinomycetes bacterium]MCP4086768.1 tRNA preQ1(34) S-adenosylmethionine ribosyltransferase-isomerase QueA [Actinomycetes bacterium]